MVRYQKLVEAENAKNAGDTPAAPAEKPKRIRKKMMNEQVAHELKQIESYSSDIQNIYTFVLAKSLI